MKPEDLGPPQPPKAATPQEQQAWNGRGTAHARRASDRLDPAAQRSRPRVERFDQWADSYDDDALQRRFFGPVHRQTLTILDRLGVHPHDVLDVGCGTGALLNLLGEHFPDAHLTGVDASEGMVGSARTPTVSSDRIRFHHAGAERLPFGDSTFDLVVSTVSFHHWADQRQGIAEVARVLSPGGTFLLADLHALSYLRVFFAAARRRHRMHSRREVEAMLHAVGLTMPGWYPVFDLGLLLPVRRRPRRSEPTGRVPLVSAVVTNKAI